MTGAAVTTAGVVHVYRVAGTDVAALRGVDLAVRPGERVALLGPSGSGKSTLLSVVAGLRRPSAGQVFVDDRDVARFSERELYAYRAGTVGLMLQGARSNLLAYASAADNLRFAVGRRRTDQAAAGVRVLADAGLADDRRPVARLDLAAQQTIALAVAMATGPRLLLVDEPTSQLAADARDRLMDALVQVTEAAGTTVLLVTHDEQLASRLPRMVRMRDGRVGAEGLRDRQYAVIGTDGSVQLPEELLAGWTPGSTVEVTAASPDELRVRRRSPEPRGEGA